jgi:cytochrome P450
VRVPVRADADLRGPVGPAAVGDPGRIRGRDDDFEIVAAIARAVAREAAVARPVEHQQVAVAVDDGILLRRDEKDGRAVMDVAGRGLQRFGADIGLGERLQGHAGSRRDRRGGDRPDRRECCQLHDDIMRRRRGACKTVPSGTIAAEPRWPCMPGGHALPRATWGETLALLFGAVGPLLAKGVIVRRPRVVKLLARTGAEDGGVRLLARLRDKYGDGPLLLRLPFRRQALILSPRHLRRVLAGTPRPFAADSREKRAALAHFQPRGVLISSGGERIERRRFNERVLQSACPIHSLAPLLMPRIVAEAERLGREALVAGAFDWKSFKAAWFRLVRQIVLGPPERDDEILTDLLERLRADANWAFLKPRRRRLRGRFLELLADRLDRAEPGSLAALMNGATDPAAAPADQAAHWLFAFDAAGIAAYRTLAMLAAYPEAGRRVREEKEGKRPFLRACLLETVRLWPTTPAILRETRAPTDWDGATLPAGTGLIVHVPFFHRDRSRIPSADRFSPDMWLAGEAEALGFVPFSAGPAECPARNLVLFLGGEWIGSLLRGRRLALPPSGRIDPERLPATFDHFSLRLAVGAG